MTNYWLWHWQAVDQQGDLQQGSWLLTGDQDPFSLLADREYLPVNCRRKKYYRKNDWKSAQKITLFQQLSALLKAGMTLTEGLKLLGEGHPHPGWQALLQALQEEVSQGTPFSVALKKWPMIFPPLFSAIIQVGELTGGVDTCCLQLAQQQEKQQKLHKKVVKALRYPVFILLVAFSVTAGMLLVVLPEFATIYESFNAPLPAFTLMVMKLSEWGQIVFLPFLIVSMLFLVIWCKGRKKYFQWQRWEQRLILRLPLIATLWRGNRLNQFFATLSLTQQAGLTLLQGLRATEETVSARLWQEAILQLQQDISTGIPLHQSILSQSLFPSLCVQLIKVGENTGALDTMLSQLANWYENNTEDLADSLTSILEPLMMVIIGIIVGALVIAMYLPVFSLGDALGKG